MLQKCAVWSANRKPMAMALISTTTVWPRTLDIGTNRDGSANIMGLLTRICNTRHYASCVRGSYCCRRLFSRIVS